MKLYTVALVDAREKNVANYRVKPHGLFLRRGEHPDRGAVIRDMMAEACKHVPLNHLISRSPSDPSKGGRVGTCSCMVRGRLGHGITW